MWLLVKLVSWLIHALIVMASVGVVSPKNPANTLPRALGVTVIVAIFVTPFSYFWWFFLLPAVIALIAWWLVYKLAYGIGFFGALGAGIVQALITFAVDMFLRRG